MAIDEIMLDIAIYRKMLTNLSDNEENGERSLKEALEAKNWHNVIQRDLCVSNPFCEKGATLLYIRKKR